MTSQKAAALLLVLVALSSAFNIDECLYPSEENATITYENFTSNGHSYSILSIDGEESFLLKNGEPVTNGSAVSDVVSSYYLGMYYPTDEEIESVRELLDIYNASRNDGQKFPGKEEYVCRGVIFIDGRVKDGTTPIYCRNENDTELCEKAAILMYQFLSSVAEVPPVASPTDLLGPIKEFGFASYGTDEALDDVNAKFDEAEDERSAMYEALRSTEDAIPELEGYLEEMEDSQFTWTKSKACDANHWCLCPDIDLNDTALDELTEEVDALLDKLGPYEQYELVVAKINSNCAERLDYALVEGLAAEYMDEFAEMNESGAAAIDMAEEATDHVSNFTLSNKLSRLKSLHLSIPDDIKNREFNITEDKLAEYEILTAEITDMSSLLLNEYNETRDAKNRLDSVLVLLETKDLDPVSMEALQLIRNESADLDAEFRDGLTMEELNVIEEGYDAVADEAEALLHVESDAPATKVLLLFRGFARNVNTGIATFAEKTEMMEPGQIPENSATTLGLFSGLVFLSLGAIVVLVFLYIAATSEFSIPKSSHILASAFLSMLILLLGFSAFMYLFLGKTSTDATLSEFLTDFESKDSTAILVDLRNASYSDAIAMGSCAGSLSESFESQNRSWTIYKVTPNTCTKMTQDANKTMTPEDCLAAAENESSSFVFQYSETNEPPKFSVIYENRAEIRANYDYYDSCPLVALFS